MNPFGTKMMLLAQEAADTLTAADEAASGSAVGWIAFLTLIALIAVPFLVGNLIATRA